MVYVCSFIPSLVQLRSSLPAYNCGHLTYFDKLEIQKEESTKKVLGFILLSYGPTQICKIMIHSHVKVLE